MGGLARWIELITLGTAAALPSAERFTSSHLVRDWMGDAVLLDVGEGAQYRLKQAGVSPTKIDYILITHAHGDHVNGLLGLLQTMHLSGRRSKLTIAGPPSVADFVEPLVRGSEAAREFPIEVVRLGEPGELVLRDAGRDQVVLRWFRACHSVESYGYVIEWRLGPRVAKGLPADEARAALQGQAEGLVVRPRPFRLAYTGDTAPCDEVVAAVQGANVLLHESTFDSSLEDEAREYGHSTSVGAATDAKRAGVGRLILTHVSTRYEGYEAYELEREARAVFPAAVLAWDLARFSMRA